MDTKIWNLFHDRTLINIQGEIPGDLSLTIDLEYLRKMFDQDGKWFLLELHKCSLFEFYPYPYADDDKAIDDQKSILNYDLWMTSAEKGNDQIIIYCFDGILKTRYRGYSIYFDTGKEVSENDLRIKEQESIKKAEK